MGRKYNEVTGQAPQVVHERADYVDAHRVLTCAAGLTKPRMPQLGPGISPRSAPHHLGLDREGSADPMWKPSVSTISKASVGRGST